MPFLALALGTTGGPRESNLTSFLLGPPEGSYFIALDAGSLLSGCSHAIERGHRYCHEKGLSDELALLHHIRAYLISHPHLDHLSGLIINSQIDRAKSILALPFTIDAIRDHLFNDIIWPNFSNEGENARNLYTYERLELGKKRKIAGTEMSVEPFLLAHSKRAPSSAFLIEKGGEYVLYLGDTASDKISGRPLLESLWRHIAPLIKEKKLRALFLECSYLKQRETHHLTAELFIEELNRLSEFSRSDLEGLKVVVIHRKEEFDEKNEQPKLIEEMLKKNNRWRVELLFPNQGESFLL